MDGGYGIWGHVPFFRRGLELIDDRQCVVPAVRCGIGVSEQRDHCGTATRDPDAILKLRNRVLETALLLVSQSEIPLRDRKVRVHLNGFLEQIDCPVVLTDE